MGGSTVGAGPVGTKSECLGCSGGAMLWWEQAAPAPCQIEAMQDARGGKAWVFFPLGGNRLPPPVEQDLNQLGVRETMGFHDSAPHLLQTGAVLRLLSFPSLRRDTGAAVGLLLVASHPRQRGGCRRSLVSAASSQQSIGVMEWAAGGGSNTLYRGWWQSERWCSPWKCDIPVPGHGRAASPSECHRSILGGTWGPQCGRARKANSRLAPAPPAMDMDPQARCQADGSQFILE